MKSGSRRLESFRHLQPTGIMKNSNGTNDTQLQMHPISSAAESLNVPTTKNAASSRFQDKVQTLTVRTRVIRRISSEAQMSDENKYRRQTKFDVMKERLTFGLYKKSEQAIIDDEQVD